MNSELLEMITGLQGEVLFFVDNGPLKSRLIERYMASDDADAEIIEFELSASLRVVRAEGAPPTFDCRLEAEDFRYQTLLGLADFAADEISELRDRLRPFCLAPSPQEARPVRSILRKKKASSLLNISEAAKGLGLSHRSLKSLIPCSETRIGEEGDNRRIEEYYWDRELIERFAGIWLKQQAGRGYNREDLGFIAASCCDNDWRWAHDCITGFLDQRKFAGSDPRE